MQINISLKAIAMFPKLCIYCIYQIDIRNAWLHANNLEKDIDLLAFLLQAIGILLNTLLMNPLLDIRVFRCRPWYTKQITSAWQWAEISHTHKRPGGSIIWTNSSSIPTKWWELIKMTAQIFWKFLWLYKLEAFIIHIIFVTYLLCFVKYTVNREHKV